MLNLCLSDGKEYVTKRVQDQVDSSIRPDIGIEEIPDCHPKNSPEFFNF